MKANNREGRLGNRWLCAWLIGSAVLGPTVTMAANEGMIRVAASTKGTQQVNLVVGKSTIVDVPVPIKRASLANPEIADAIVLTVAPSAPESRRWDPDEVMAWGRSEGLPPIRSIPELRKGLDRASTMAPHGTIVVTGSVHTVGDALQILEIPV